MKFLQVKSRKSLRNPLTTPLAFLSTAKTTKALFENPLYLSTHTLFLSLKQTLSLSLSQTNSLSLFLSNTLTLYLSNKHTHSISLSLSLSPFLSLPFSLSLSNTHTLSLSECKLSILICGIGLQTLQQQVTFFRCILFKLSAKI